MALFDHGKLRSSWRHLMPLVALWLAACNEGPSVLSVKPPLGGDRIKLAVEPGQRIDFEFELSAATPIQRNRDLQLDFDADGRAGGTVMLENFFALSTPPTVRLQDNRIVASGELIAVANAEREDPLQAVLENLEAPAAGGSFVSASIPLFSYLGATLSERFRSRFSATGGTAVDGEAEPAAGGAAKLLDRIRDTLAIIHAANELNILQDYKQRIQQLQEKINLRTEAGVSWRTDADLIQAWMLNAEQKQAQFQTALELTLDDFENSAGTRPPTYTGYPSAWDAQMPAQLETLLNGLPEKDHALARQYWRLASLEAGNLNLQQQLQERIQDVHAGVLSQFSIGQRTLSDVLTSEKGLFENAIVTNDTQYRLHLAQAELYGVLGRPPRLEPVAWQRSGGIE